LRRKMEMGIFRSNQREMREEEWEKPEEK
jgi:hypothetical protein